MTSHPSLLDANHDGSFFSDSPITSIEDDKLGRAEFAKRIAKTIVTRNDPSCLTIGLYGAWGSGKTSMLKMIKEEIEKLEKEDNDNASKKDRKNVLRVGVMDFNPWFFRSEEALLQNLLSELAITLLKEISVGYRDTLSNYLKKYAKRMGLTITVPFPSLCSRLKDFGAILLDPHHWLKWIQEKYRPLPLTTIKSGIEHILQKEGERGKKTVIFIDDIDRLDKEEIHALFKAIKLTVDFPYITYVLAFDHDVVTASLQERYCDLQKNAGEAFLEKIIQVPLPMPMPDKDILKDSIRKKIEDALAFVGISLDSDQENRFWECFNIGILPKITTLRLSNLYCNALLFSLPLLKGEVCPADLMLIESARLFYPKLYECIKHNFYNYLEQLSEDWSEEEAIKITFESVLSADVRSEIDHLHNIFLHNLFPHRGTREEREAWDREKRICSTAYFHKYFMYAVPSQDIPDKIIDSFFASLDSEEATTLELFQAMFVNYNSHVVLIRCEEKLKDLSIRHIISFFYFLFYNEPFTINALPLHQERYIIYNFIYSFPSILLKFGEEKKRSFLKAFVKDAALISFVVPCFCCLRKVWLISKEGSIGPCYSESLALLATKLKLLDEASPLYKQDEINMLGSYLLLKDALGEKEFNTYLTSRFKRFPEDVDSFVKSLCEWPEPITFAPEKNNDEIHFFPFTKEIIDPKYIADNLTSRYGKKLDTSYAATNEEEDARLRRARAFISQYKKRFPILSKEA